MQSHSDDLSMPTEQSWGWQCETAPCDLTRCMRRPRVKGRASMPERDERATEPPSLIKDDYRLGEQDS